MLKYLKIPGEKRERLFVHEMQNCPRTSFACRYQIHRDVEPNIFDEGLVDTSWSVRVCKNVNNYRPSILLSECWK